LEDLSSRFVEVLREQSGPEAKASCSRAFQLCRCFGAGSRAVGYRELQGCLSRGAAPAEPWGDRSVFSDSASRLRGILRVGKGQRLGVSRRGGVLHSEREWDIGKRVRRLHLVTARGQHLHTQPQGPGQSWLCCGPSWSQALYPRSLWLPTSNPILPPTSCSRHCLIPG
jgi:hypothetical protein